MKTESYKSPFKYKYKVEDLTAEIQEMKHLISIAYVQKSFNKPLPHLKRHQAFLTLGYGRRFKEIETKFIAEDLFSPEIKAEVSINVLNLFKGKDYGKAYDYCKEEIDNQEMYNFDILPNSITKKYKYVQSVLFYEAVTKMIMNRESCNYKTATALALGMDVPCYTPYGDHWKNLFGRMTDTPVGLRTRSKDKTKTKKR